jgi:hypothetical protein
MFEWLTQLGTTHPFLPWMVLIAVGVLVLLLLIRVRPWSTDERQREREHQMRSDFESHVIRKVEEK